MTIDAPQRPARPWPDLPPADTWSASCETLQLFTQVVGKVRLANTPTVNHWWNVPLYVTPRGLTTSLIPHPTGPAFQVDFDLVDHRLDLVTADGARRSTALGPRSVADFHAAVGDLLADAGVATDIWPVPVEMPGAIAFADDDAPRVYDPAAVTSLRLILIEAVRVLTDFRARFVGKCSPVHVFWGAFDLAVTRFSGRTAPPHPGGAPNCGPHVMFEAYSHEVSSCGYWPGGPAGGSFYSYAYPEPPGYRDAPAGPAGATWDDALGEFVLPYEALRAAADPDATLMEFLQATYDAAADAADWDRGALKRTAGPDGEAAP